MVEPPRNAIDVTEDVGSHDVRGSIATPLEIVDHSPHPLEYSTKAEKLQLRCSVTVSTTSSISADTVASLGGEGKAKTFIESVTAKFARTFSNELEQELHNACRDNNSGENPISYPEEFAVEVSDDKGSGEPMRQVFRKPGHEPRVHEEDDIDKKKSEAMNPTRIRRNSVMKSSKHLEDYSEADSPDSLHKNSDADSDADYHRDSSRERLVRPINADTRRDSEDEHSINSDSGQSNVESDESVRSKVATEDLKVVLQKLDEVFQSFTSIGLSNQMNHIMLSKDLGVVIDRNQQRLWSSKRPVRFNK